MNSKPAEGHPNFSSSDPIETPMNPDSIEDRKEVFRVLVQLQDRGESVQTSRALISAQFRISQEEVVGIEREGISQSWPPLD